MLPLLCTIAIGLTGASCFTVGIVWSITEMTIIGISLISLSIIAMGLLYWVWRVTSAPTTITHSQEEVRYSTNNMNTMKRNKSDTDLELINKQTEMNTV